MEREKRSGPNTEPCGIPYFTGRKSDANKLFSICNKIIKKLSAWCHWIIHKELISAKVDHD